MTKPVRKHKSSRPPFDSKYAAKRKKDGSTVYHGGAPKRATKGVINQLRRLKSSDLGEFNRQLAELPADEQKRALKRIG